MHAECAGLPECFRVTGNGGPKHPSVFSVDRVDILNVHRLLFCFKLRTKKLWSIAIDYL